MFRDPPTPRCILYAAAFLIDAFEGQQALRLWDIAMQHVMSPTAIGKCTRKA